jgi:Tol biopolymer transport system component
MLVYQKEVEEVLYELSLYSDTWELIGQLGEPEHYDTPRFSPDKRFVAVELRDRDLGANDLWIFDVERNIRTRFTFEPGDDYHPVWSPDGTEIIFASQRGDRFGMYRRPAFTAGEERVVYETDRMVEPNDWSADGEWLLFEMEEDIWAIRLSGDEPPLRLTSTKNVEVLPSLSPDGKWLSYCSDESGRGEIYATSFPEPGRRWQISQEYGYGGEWNEDGSAIFYVNYNNMNLMKVPLEFAGSSLRIGKPEILLDLEGARSGDISDDGSLFVVCRQIGSEKKLPLTLVVNWTEDLRDR